MTIHNTQEERPDEPDDEDAVQPEYMTGMSVEQEPAPIADPLPTVGDDLRMRRQEAGHSIEDVSEAIRVQKRYLEALEDGRIDDLPGTVYALGFLRTYANYYGFNGDAFVTRFKEETEGRRREQDYVLPEPIEEARVPTAAIVIVAIVLAVVAYVAWYSLRPQEAENVGAVPEVPAHLAMAEEETLPAVMPAQPDLEFQPEPVVAAAAVPETGSPAAADANAEVPLAGEAPAVVTEAETRPALQSAEMESAQTPAAPAETPVDDAPAAAVEEVAALTPPEPSAADAPSAPVVEEVVHTPQSYGAANTDARIIITALEDSWIEIADAEGNRLMSRTLRAGDSYRVPNREGLVFVTGNAGGLKITVDGAPAPAIGDIGVVRKNVKLDPELLKEGRAWP